MISPEFLCSRYFYVTVVRVYFLKNCSFSLSRTDAKFIESQRRNPIHVSGVCINPEMSTDDHQVTGTSVTLYSLFF